MCEWIASAPSPNRRARKGRGSYKRKYHCGNLPTASQTALIIFITQNVHWCPEFHCLNSSAEQFDFMGAHPISRHCNRIANHHPNTICATLIFISDMHPFPSSAATAKSFVDFLLNHHFTQPLPKCNQCWLSLTCCSICCPGKVVQDMKILHRKAPHSNTELRRACMLRVRVRGRESNNKENTPSLHKTARG